MVSFRRSGEQHGMSATSAMALARLETYADTAVWSISFRAWTKYDVKKPRLPTVNDKTLRFVDSARNRPASFSQFVGKQNDEAVKSLRRLCELFENTKQLPAVIVVQGRSGSGKSALVHVFLQQLCEIMNIAESKVPALPYPSSLVLYSPYEGVFTSLQMGRFVTKFDAADFLPPSSFEALWREIRKITDAPVDRVVSASWKLVVLDNVDSIPLTAQLAMRKTMEGAPKLKFVLIVRDVMKLTAAVQEKVPYPTLSYL